MKKRLRRPSEGFGNDLKITLRGVCLIYDCSSDSFYSQISKGTLRAVRIDCGSDVKRALTQQIFFP